MKKRILFVDDEQSMLNGLRRSLRGQRKEWDMTFALSGREALDLVDRELFDAVVTDMRMPGMDGAQLLGELIRRHPDLIRMVLSGYSDEEVTIKTVKSAHQYLAKPCDIGFLKALLARAFTLKDLLADEKLQAVVSGLKSVPSLPVVYGELMERLASNNASLQEVGEIIGKDPAMTAKILQLVNSAFFGIGRVISSPAEAAAYLGLETLTSLVISVGVFQQFDSSRLGSHSFSIDGFVAHSMAVALCAKRIAMAENADKSIVEQSLLAGFLHDLGKLVLANNFPEKYSRVAAPPVSGETEEIEVEQASFGASHGVLGAYLLGLWGLAEPVVEAVAFHHQPHLIPHQKHFSPLIAVHAANLLVNYPGRREAPELYSAIDTASLENLGMLERLEAWRELYQEADTSSQEAIS